MKQGWAETLEKYDYSESSDGKLKERIDKMYTYLILACKDKPFNMVTSKDNRKNACKG
jgi:predicted YcjX-like family ATPase